MNKKDLKTFIDSRIKLYSRFSNTFKTEGGKALADKILNAYYFKLNQMREEDGGDVEC